MEDFCDCIAECGDDSNLILGEVVYCSRHAAFAEEEQKYIEGLAVFACNNYYRVLGKDILFENVREKEKEAWIAAIVEVYRSMSSTL